jgi:hypothetical protein
MVVSWYRILANPITILCFLACAGRAQESAGPLPDRDSFLRAVRRNLHSDRLLLSQYTFTEKMSVRTLGKNGQVRKTDERIYEVYPSVEEELTYRKLISRDGKPLSPKELAGQEREQDKKLGKYRRRLERSGPDGKSEADAKAERARREEEEVLDEILDIYDVTMLGRSLEDQHSAIILSFQPRRSYKPRTDGGKVLAKVGGKAWVAEEDLQIIRVEAQLVDSISFGLGLLARLDRGATAVFERRRVNNEIWLPASARFAGTGRLLLFKGLNLDIQSDYSDYRRFSVKTLVEFETDKKK